MDPSWGRSLSPWMHALVKKAHLLQRGPLYIIFFLKKAVAPIHWGFFFFKRARRRRRPHSPQARSTPGAQRAKGCFMMLAVAEIRRFPSFAFSRTCLVQLPAAGPQNRRPLALAAAAAAVRAQNALPPPPPNELQLSSQPSRGGPPPRPFPPPVPP